MDRDQILKDLKIIGFYRPTDLCIAAPNEHKRRSLSFVFVGRELAITSLNIMGALGTKLDTNIMVVRRAPGENQCSAGFYYEIIAHNCLVPLDWRD